MHAQDKVSRQGPKPERVQTNARQASDPRDDHAAGPTAKVIFGFDTVTGIGIFAADQERALTGREGQIDTTHTKRDGAVGSEPNLKNKVAGAVQGRRRPIHVARKIESTGNGDFPQ